MAKPIKNIKQVKSSFTESELQVVVACNWLKLGITGMQGGIKLSHWLENNKDHIESIFGADDRLYVRTKTPDKNKELVEFILNEKIGDELQWIQCKDSERWWLLIWWS